MSHGNERKEKVCLNCNARVFGPYCHVCGQHNIEPKETAIGLVVHFFNDITHFEGKFITSLRYLLFRPGFLTKEYERGRRASYMNPVRMYVFASAFFFILFFSFFSDNKGDIIKVNETPQKGRQVKPSAPGVNPLQEALKEADTKEDSANIQKVVDGAGALGIKVNEDSSDKKKYRIADIAGQNYRSVGAYDSAQKALPADERDSWLERSLTRRLILTDQKYGGDLKKFNEAVLDHALHSLPKLLFISLPLFAFFLYVMYVRHRRFFYVTHVVFTIHFYVFVFLMLLFIFTNQKIGEAVSWWPTGLLAFAAWIYMFIYLYKAMRRLYEQRRAKTILKYFLLLFLILILYSFLFIALFSYSVFNV